MNDEIQSRWPNLQHETSSSQKGPCPFCPPDSSTTYLNGVGFTGTDRCFVKYNGCGCRVCKAEGRGRNGWHNIREIYIRFGLTPPDKGAVIEQPEKKDDPLTKLWHDEQVRDAHKAVDYKFWQDKYGWGKDVVDRFRLGWGDIYTNFIGPAHLIPTQATHYEKGLIPGFYMSARRDGKKIRTPGSPKKHFWLVETDPSDKTVFLGEGEKEPISAIVNDIAKNAVCTYSSDNIGKGLLEALWAKGYRHVILGGDNDAAGRHFNEKLAKWARELKFYSARYIGWPESLKEGTDTTDVYRDGGSVMDWLVDLSMVLDVAPAVTEPIQIVPRDELRGEGPNSVKGALTEFLATYENNTMLILAPPPGAGKTHTLVKVIEQRAVMFLEKKKAQREALIDTIADLEKQLAAETDTETRDKLSRTLQQKNRQLEHWSNASIGFFGQFINQWQDLLDIGIDTDLWYNFEARNPDNCANFPLVTRLGQKNHDIGGFCNSGCPFKERCKYLAQEKAMADKPIIFFRHNNLFQAMQLEEYYVDENPIGLWMIPIDITQKDLYPFESDRDYEDEWEWDQLKLFMAAVRAAMSANAGAGHDNQIMGADFYRLVQDQLGDTPLNDILDIFAKETLEAYHPSFHGGIENPDIKLRCVKELIKVMRREMAWFVENPHNKFVSCVTLINGQLRIMGQNTLRIPARIPLIVADGTAPQDLLEIAFGRTSTLFKPEIRNPNCVTTVVKGSDWTKGQLNRETQGKTRRPKKVAGVEVAALPGSHHIIDSKYVQEATTLINGLAEKHGQLYVVMYQLLRTILEAQLFDTHPHLRNKVGFGHYGATRGTNRFKDWPAALLIGAYRIPYDVLYQQICMWAVLGERQYVISRELVDKELAYDGIDDSASYKTFAHKFADDFVRYVEESELRQSAERIRAHASDEKKWIYTAFERPALRAVTRVVKKAEFLDQFRPSKRQLIKKLLLEGARHNLQFKGEWKYPPQSVIAKEVGCSNRDIQEAKKQIAEEGLDLTPPVEVQ
jgi:hypothetical protein